MTKIGRGPIIMLLQNKCCFTGPFFCFTTFHVTDTAAYIPKYLCKPFAALLNDLNYNNKEANKTAQECIQPPNSAKATASYRTTVYSDMTYPGIIHTEAVKNPPIILLSVLTYSGTRCVAMAKSHYLTVQCQRPK